MTILLPSSHQTYSPGTNIHHINFHKFENFFNKLKYELLNANKFYHLNSKNGMISIKSKESLPCSFVLKVRMCLIVPDVLCSDPFYINITKKCPTNNNKISRKKRDVRPEFTMTVNETHVGPIATIVPFYEGERYEIASSDLDLIGQPLPIEIDLTTGMFSVVPGQYLDYETSQNLELYLNIYTRDGGYDTQKVTLWIRDVNDENPRFVNAPLPMQAVVPVNALPGTSVFKLVARDDDAGAYLRYSLDSDTSKRFKVDPITGAVETRGTEPFGPVGTEYSLRVSAHDKAGSPDQIARATLSVVAGTRKPQFYSPAYSLNVTEDRPVDSIVGYVKAKSFTNRDMLYNLDGLLGPSDNLKDGALESASSPTFAIRKTALGGEIRLLKKLDYDDYLRPKRFELNARATEVDENGNIIEDQSSTAQVVINIVDVNDNDPIFSQPEYVKQKVEENIQIGSSILKVTANDADSGQFSKLTYNLSDTENFTVGSDGVIRNRAILNYEIPKHGYEFIVTALDGGSPPRKSSAVVKIFMTNMNDEAPVFSRSVYVPEIAEDAKPGAVVTTVNAVDPDGDKVIYSFKGGTEYSDDFHINKDGVITINSDPSTVLRKEYYTLNVTAIDDGSCCSAGAGGDHVTPVTHVTEALVVVRVQDINNNKPEFPECPNYEPTVAENAAPGTPVIQVKATDNDSGNNGRVKYKIEKRPNQENVFSIDEDSGLIKTTVPFDREEFLKRAVTVTATDLAPRPLIGVCTFQVNIGDVNDNEPRFSQSQYDKPIEADTGVGTSFLRVSAQDPDEGLNAEIEYSLDDKSGFFGIDPETGWIYVKSGIQGEKVVTSTAIATDKGTPAKSSTVSVRIVVTGDANQPPSWPYGPYEHISLSENSPRGSQVAWVYAQSNFQDPRVQYSIIPGNNAHENFDRNFELRSDPRNLSAAIVRVYESLDYEKVQEFNLTLRAKNNAAVQLSTDTYMHIKIVDANDNAPIFTLDSYPASVPEDAPIGTGVIKLLAEDGDRTYPNNKVTYEIVKEQTYLGPDDGEGGAEEDWKSFDINPDTGQLITKLPLDRETKPIYLLRVMAKDGADSAINPGYPNTGFAYVRIKVEDVNDNVPYFLEPLYTADVDENAIENTVVTEVAAKDLDEDFQMRYQLTTGNIGGVFDVKPQTGEIYVRGKLDYEEGPRVYDLKVVVSDGLNENHTFVKINVKDVNDNAPEFDKTVYEIWIQEEDGNDLPKTILEVRATDKDAALPADIRYSLQGQGVEEGTFTINSLTGEIRVTRKLDRDPPHGQPIWSLLALATDDGGQGNYGYADIRINLNDINDNAPIFDAGPYIGHVLENAEAGRSVMIMTARDYDDGENAKMTYNIKTNVLDKDKTPIFAIDPISGLITTQVADLDRELLDRYTIEVEARDKDGLSGSGIATIHVEDRNDQPPIFEHKVYRVSVSENAPLNSPVLYITARDGDIGDNAKLTYLLKDEVVNAYHGSDGSEPGPNKYPHRNYYFMMGTDESTNSGILKIAKELDFDDPSLRFFNLTAEASDGLYADTTHIEVSVTDYNDNPPEFDRNFRQVSIPENTPVGFVLTQFTAKDRDSGLNGVFDYVIKPKSKFDKPVFTINATGHVILSGSLDMEKDTYHIITILAVDRGEPGNPSLTGTAKLRVDVIDVNDNYPRLLIPTDPPPIVPENVNPPFVVGLFTATDADSSPGFGGPFRFYALPCDVNPYCTHFNLSHVQDDGPNKNGAALITALRTFDREAKKHYELPIRICDSGVPPQCGVDYLPITVGDSNDNPQGPGHKNIMVYNYKGMMPEINIGTVFAEDADDWNVGVDKNFTIATSPPPEHFYVEPDSGTIFVRKNTPDGIYRLRVKVYDSKFDLTTFSTVTITVKRIDDDAIYNAGSFTVAGMIPETFLGTQVKQRTKRALGDNINDNSLTSLSADPVSLTNKPESDNANSLSSSLMDSLKAFIANKLFGEASNSGNVDIFSIKRSPESTKLLPKTDVQFSVQDDINGPSKYLPPVKLHSMLLTNLDLIRTALLLNITEVSIDPCAKKEICESLGCTNKLVIGSEPLLINSNRSSFVGIDIHIEPKCQCAAKTVDPLILTSTCLTTQLRCLNGGMCRDYGIGNYKCECPPGFLGPRCEGTSVHLSDGGSWIWLPPLAQCQTSLLSLEFVTQSNEGHILYNGPLSANEISSNSPDYISLYMKGGSIVLELNLGVSLELTTRLELTPGAGKLINDGNWHKIEIYRSGNYVRMTLDSCDASSFPQGSYCYNITKTSGVYELLNVRNPLQLGALNIQTGLLHPNIPVRSGFVGCVRNLAHDGTIYDMSMNTLDHLVQGGCPAVDHACDTFGGCGPNGNCLAGLVSSLKPVCQCAPGWSGTNCQFESMPADFGPKESFVRFALKNGDGASNSIGLSVSEYSRYSTVFELSFRTILTGSNPNAALPQTFRLFQSSSVAGNQYAHLDIVTKPFYRQGTSANAANRSQPNELTRHIGGYLRFRFNLGTNARALLQRRSSGTNLKNPLTLDQSRQRTFVDEDASSDLHALTTARPESGDIEVSLPHYLVTDGEWHRVVVERVGIRAKIEVDGGGRPDRYNYTEQEAAANGGGGIVTFTDSLATLELDTRGIYVGASVREVGEKRVEVELNFVGCVNDFRLDSQPIQFRGENSVASVLESRNVREGCTDPTGGVACSSPLISCPSPLVCFNKWRHHFCDCPTGYSRSSHLSSSKGDVCYEVDECSSSFSNPCSNGGLCTNMNGSFACSCLPGWSCETCDCRMEPSALSINGSAVATMTLSALLVLVLLAFLLFYARCFDRNSVLSSNRKKSGQDGLGGSSGKLMGGLNLGLDGCNSVDNVMVLARENVVKYQDEGGGEEDIHTFDLSRLRKPAHLPAPINNLAMNGNAGPVIGLSREEDMLLGRGAPLSGRARPSADLLLPDLVGKKPRNFAGDGLTPNLGDFIRNRLREADMDTNLPLPAPKIFSYEGGGSLSGSLSSLASGNEDDDLDFDLDHWGPRFQKLADMYRTIEQENDGESLYNNT